MRYLAALRSVNQWEDAVGFEPTKGRPRPFPVFKAGAFDHSAKHPLMSGLPRAEQVVPRPQPTVMVRSPSFELGCPKAPGFEAGASAVSARSDHVDVYADGRSLHRRAVRVVHSLPTARRPRVAAQSTLRSCGSRVRDRGDRGAVAPAAGCCKNGIVPIARDRRRHAGQLPVCRPTSHATWLVAEDGIEPSPLPYQDSAPPLSCSAEILASYRAWWCPRGGSNSHDLEVAGF